MTKTKIYLIECTVSDRSFNYEKAFLTADARYAKMAELREASQRFLDACVREAPPDELHAALDKCYLQHGHITFEADEVELEEVWLCRFR